MDSKRDTTLNATESWEESYDLVEAANRLNVFYIFEDIVCFTDTFIKTIKTINENDFAWKMYMSHLNLPIDPRNHADWDNGLKERWFDPLWKMSAALVTVHVKMLDLNVDNKDFFTTIDYTSAFFHRFLRDRYSPLTFSKEELEDWSRERFPHDWLPLLLALATM